MVTPRQYATAGAFRAALEVRLLEQSRSDDVDLQRLRRQVAFDRLLARMFDPSNVARDSWVLRAATLSNCGFDRPGQLRIST